MHSKRESKPMQNLLKRLKAYENEFELVIFSDDMILNRPVEEWAHCDCLISFFSTGFPLEKAIKYRQLHPTMFCLNEIAWQKVLLG